MKYFLIAGERSGDLHGSNLVKALRQFDPDGEFLGFGGDEMERAGVKLTVQYRELAVMGFISLATSLFRIFRYLKQCQAEILAAQPDAVILIDYGGFNLRLAPTIKAQGIPVYYYISPKVWAWNQSRTYKLKKYTDKVFSILPFEKDFFHRFDFEVDYVGNPVLDAIKSFHPNTAFRKSLNVNADKRLVALLPGSRAMELKRIVPLMATLADGFPEVQFVVAVVNNLSPDLYEPFKSRKNVILVQDATYDLLTVADAAIVTSGTATLETGIFKVPQVVVYKTSPLEYQLVKALIKVEFISLVNLIAAKPVIQELIQRDANPESVRVELQKLLFDESYRAVMKAEYETLYRILDTGSASRNTARLLVNDLRQRKK